MERDGNTRSLWQSVTRSWNTDSAEDTQHITYDAAIIGAGITGLSLAIKLQEAGLKCIVIEACNIGYGTTGGTTAHLNTVLDTPYATIIEKFGPNTAKLVAESTKDAIKDIRNNIKKYSASCDFEEQVGFMYAVDSRQEDALMEIKSTLQHVGIHATETKKLALPAQFKNAIAFGGQAQFHPIKYILSLARTFHDHGGIIVEYARVTKVSTEDQIKLIWSEQRRWKAKYVTYATHIPPGVNMLHFKCAPYRSYVIGVQLQDKDCYPNGLFYDMENPFHYFRTAWDGNEKILLVGGMDHKTGHELKVPIDPFAGLEALAANLYPVKEVKYKWSSQYYEPADGLPYIGLLPGADADVYCATGFSGNGMIFGTLSASIIAGQILGQPVPIAALLSSQRSKPVAEFSQMVKENADVIKRFVADRLGLEKMNECVTLDKGEGRVVRYKHQVLAIYKDDYGNLSVLKARCPHAGCVVQWNTTEKSWDCPCHGARYDITGKVSNGPSDKDLDRVDLS